MATKLTGWCKKFGVVVFTSLVAPVLVNLVVRDVPDEAGRPEPTPSRQHKLVWQSSPSLPVPTSFSPAEPQPPQQIPSAVAAISQPVKIVRVVAHGIGRTPEAALQDALGDALRQVLASQVDALTWSRNGFALCSGILRDSKGILIGWRNLGACKQWSVKGTFYQEDLAVEVNLTALVDRLRLGFVAG